METGPNTHDKCQTGRIDWKHIPAENEEIKNAVNPLGRWKLATTVTVACYAREKGIVDVER